MWRREGTWCAPLRVRQIGRTADLHGAAARRARHMDVPSASPGRTSTLTMLVESRARFALFSASARLWWPRRPLATLGRKPRQGRKAATVSIDAGAEVSRRGHRLFHASHEKPKIREANLGPRLCASDPRPFGAPPYQGGFAPEGSGWPVATGQLLSQRSYPSGAVENPARAGRQQRYRSTRVPRQAGRAIAFFMLRMKNPRFAKRILGPGYVLPIPAPSGRPLTKGALLQKDLDGPWRRANFSRNGRRYLVARAMA